MAKINYSNKVDSITRNVANINKVTAADMNQIKEAVNNNVDTKANLEGDNLFSEGVQYFENTENTATINVTNQNNGFGIFVNNKTDGSGVYLTNKLSGVGVNLLNHDSGKGIFVTNIKGGNAIVASGVNTEQEGFNYVGQNDTTNTFTVNKEGDVIANTFTGDGSALTNLPSDSSKVGKVAGSSLIADTSITRLENTSGTNTGDQDLNGYQLKTEKGQANGYASLGADSLVPPSQLPSYVDDVLEFANLASFPATGEAGKIYVALDTNKTYRWSGSTYIFITSGAVDSVNTQTGVVVLDKEDIGLTNVDNTTDANKPVSTAQATAIGLKAPKASPSFTGDATFAGSVTASTITLYREDGSVVEGDIIGAIDFYNNDNSSEGDSVNARILAYASDNFGRTGLKLFTGDKSNTLERLEIKTNGDFDFKDGDSTFGGRVDVKASSNLALNIENLNTTNAHHGLRINTTNTDSSTRILYGLANGVDAFVVYGNKNVKAFADFEVVGESTLGGDVSIGAGKKLKFNGNSFITPENNVSGAEISTAGTFIVKTGATPTLGFTVDASQNSTFSGNVGIVGKLDITASNQAAAFTSTTNAVPLSVYSNNESGVSSIGFKGKDSATDFNVRVGADENDFITYTNNEERLRIKSNGDLDFKSGAATFGGNVGIERGIGGYTFLETAGGDERAGIKSNSANDLIFNYANELLGMTLDGVTGNLDVENGATFGGSVSIEKSGLPLFKLQEQAEGGKFLLQGVDTNNAFLRTDGNLLFQVGGSVTQYQINSDGSHDFKSGAATFGGSVAVASSNSSGGGVLNLENTTTSVNGSQWGKLNFISNDSTSGASGIRASIQAYSNGFRGGTDLVFRTAPESSSEVERLRINKDGDATFGGSLEISNTSAAVFRQKNIHNGVAQSWIKYVGSNGHHIFRDETNSRNHLVFQNDGITRIDTDATFGGDVKMSKSSTPVLELNRADTSIFTGQGVATIKATADDGGVGSVGAQIDFRAGNNWVTNSYRTDIVFSNDDNGTLTERFVINSSGSLDFKTGDASFGGSVTADSFVGNFKENYRGLQATHTLLDSDYNLHAYRNDTESTVTIPLGLGTERSWNFSSAIFGIYLVAATGVTITIVTNGQSNNTNCEAGRAARLMATDTANEYIFIKI